MIRFLPLVRSAAVQLRGMAGSVLQEEDLIDQGVLALMDAMERYDESHGAKFETYAFLRVRGSMIDHIRSQDWVPHLSLIHISTGFSIRSPRRMPQATPMSLSNSILTATCRMELILW